MFLLQDLLHANYLVSTIEQLNLLKHLDVSFFIEKLDSRGHNQNFFPVFFEIPYILPDLVMLDVSGWKEVISKESLNKFIETHPKLEFLGLVLCSVNFEPTFSNPKSVDYPSNVIIAGLANEDQIRITLRKYKDR